MGLWKKSVLFYLGGSAYMMLEYLWRGRSHGSMFLLGGACFCLLGKLDGLRINLAARTALGAGTITVLELLTGLAVNRDYRIWDYRELPLNFRGQICLPYCLLWLPVSLGAILLYRLADRHITVRADPS